MATKPIKFLELYYAMTQFLIISDIDVPYIYIHLVLCFVFGVVKSLTLTLATVFDPYSCHCQTHRQARVSTEE